MDGQGPAFNPETMASLVKQATITIQASLSKSSRANYEKTLSDFRNFSYQANLQSGFPLNQGSVLLYLSHLQKSGLASSTITSKLSALNYYQKINGFQDITSHFLISKFISGLNKISRAIDIRIPVTPEILHQFHVAVPVVSTSVFYSTLYKSMFSLSFFAFLRPGEITSSHNNIELSNVNLSKDNIAITFTKFKHHTGPPVTVVVQSQNTTPCPVQCMANYLRLRGTTPGPLFCHQGGSPITYTSLNNFFSAIQSFLQLGARYHLHSFRIGAATSAALRGIPEDEIKRMGRWSSSAYSKYIRIQTIRL